MTRPAVFSAAFHKPQDFEALEAMTGMKVVIGRDGIKLVDRIEEIDLAIRAADDVQVRYAGAQS